MPTQKDFFSIGQSVKASINRTAHRQQWVEDNFIGGQAQEEYLSSSFNLDKLKWFFLVIIIFFAVIVGRVGYLQLVKGQDYRQAAEENRLRIQEIKAPRGIIYDRYGQILSNNVPNFTLTFIPADLPLDAGKKQQLTEKIASILETTAADIASLFSQAPAGSYQSFTIREKIPYNQALQLKIASADLPGVSLNTSTARQYLVDQTFAHLLGYTGKVSPADLKEHPDYSYDDYIGKAGIESYYEQELKGAKGKKEIEVDSLGKESKIITQTKPVNGENITLTVDGNLQKVLGTAINKVVGSAKGITGAAAVAIDPNNGEILALASSPAFDNQAMNDGLTQAAYDQLANDPKMPLFDRAISAEYPSGSTIKPLISLAALQEGIISEHTTFLSTGGIRIGQWFFPDWKAGGHGVTDVKRALSESINTFFYIIGGGYEDVTGLGVDRINSYLKLFGLGQPLGIDLAGEAGGFLPTKEWKEETKKENWYIGDTYHLSIGQGDLLVTPLQVASYTATVANGGTYYRPHLVKSFSDANHNVTREIQPVIIRNNFINSDYYRIVREGLRQGVTSGSSSELASLPFTVAGKTGTAQFGDLDKTHAWYTCFAPYENPQIAITVIVEGAGEGHQIALPIAREGLMAWYNAVNRQ